MNFDNLKKQMDEVVNSDNKKIDKINLKSGKNNPVAKIRRNMLFEIFAQLIMVVLLFAYPTIKPMEELPKALFYIIIFIIGLIGLGYTIKLTSFLKQTSTFTTNTKDALKEFIYQAKLTLEVFKSLVIAVSLIIPIPIFLILTGRKDKGNMAIFNKWIRLDVSNLELIGLISGYLVIAVIIYFVTVSYTKIFYTKYVNQLEETLDELEA